MQAGAFLDHTGWYGIALALALGLLVGLQRGWAQRKDSPGTRFAGIRTYGLFGLAGGVSGWLFADARELATIILASTAVLIVVSYYRMTQSGGSISGTSSVSGLLTLACGFLATTGEAMSATMIAVSMMLVLAMRSQLHRLVRRMSEAEVTAISRFALIALVILPLLPDEAYGPYEAWNPRQLWLLVVLVSGFMLLGYVAAKLLGPTRGTIATAAAGSMVSSTAVTAALATQLRDDDANPVVLWAGIAAASAVMFLRVMVLTGALAPFALPSLARLAVPGMAVSLAIAGSFLWRARKAPSGSGDALPVKNPFSLGPALILMLLAMAMSLIARWVLERFGDAGLAVVLAISGSVDVDSAIITLGGLPRGTLTPRVAGMVLLAPIVLNTLFKAGIAVSMAGWRRGWPGALSLVLSAAASLVALAAIA